jgi:DNA-binding CsgD family transcriptional regulator
MRIRAPVMVGRDDQLRLVATALEQARSARGGALFITGQAGIGKSRLAAAATDLAFAADMTIARGRGSSVGPMVPYRSLTEALLSLLRSGDRVDVTELGPYRPILARLLPDLGPPPAGQDAASLAVLAEAVLRLTSLAGRRRGCLLLLDDLQDADAETLGVVEYLADNLGQQPTLLLATVRDDPGPAAALAQAAAQRGAARLAELGALSAPDMSPFAAACLGSDEACLPAGLAEHLWTSSGGVPLLAEEVLSGLLQRGMLIREGASWRVAGALRTTVPVTLARAMAGRLELIGAPGRELLSAAAVLGPRFPLSVLQAATGLADRELLSHLHAEVIAQLIGPDEQTPDWYAFQHPLIVEVLLSLLTPGERARIAGQAADAVAAVYPGLPGEWCQACAALRQAQGQPGPAGRLFAEAGRRAIAQGAASSAVSLLDTALELLAADADPQTRADVFAARLTALAEAGQVERVFALTGELERVGGLLSQASRARLHTRLAWAAVVAGRPADGLAQVEIARRLLGPGASDRDLAPIDVVAAHLALDLPGPDQVATAELLGRRAAAVAEAAQMPEVACQAWQLLGALCRSRDPAEATGCLERALKIAVEHQLPIEEIHALIRLGNDDALRDGNLRRLEEARQHASRAGAVTARYQAEASIALQAILSGDAAAAQALIDQVLTATMRLNLVETTQYALLLRAILGAHQGRRRDMDAALAELAFWKGDHALHVPRIYGLARAWCSLLEENRDRAQDELAHALTAEEQSPTVFQLTGRYGLDLLLRVLSGAAGPEEYERVTAAPVSRLRWDRQLAQFAGAVLAGRAGRGAEAAGLVTAALRTGAPYTTASHLGLRLVSEAALADGWGSPVGWLRTAEEYFHSRQIPAVASACRALLRRTGAPVNQRRTGSQAVPAALRAAGVTVREYEILALLRERLSNREIAGRLHLSPRTVEKHVASLISKTGLRDRIALAELGSATIG